MRFLGLFLLLISLPLNQLYAGEELLVYSGRSEKFVSPVMEAFTRETGIKVALLEGSSTALLAKLQNEGNASPADLYISNDAGNLQKGADLQLFRVLPRDIFRNIPSNYRSQTHDWLGLSARARVLVVNTGSPLIKNLTSVFDLATPALKGQIALTSSRNESFIAGVTVYMQLKGKAATRNWLSGMKQNLTNGSVFKEHSQVVEAVAKGQKAVGLVNHYYIYRYLEKHPHAPINILLPDQTGMGVAWNVAGAAIAKHSKRIKAAERLMAFMVSKAGQKLFTEVDREYPARPGISAAREVPAVATFKIADVPMTSLGKLRDETLELINAVGMP